MDALVVRREDDFDFDAAEYARLYECSHATPFQHGAWLTRLYSQLAPALGADRVVVVARRESDGELVLVLPMVARRRGPIRVVEDANLGVADYAAPVVHRAYGVAISNDASVATRIAAALGSYDLLRVQRVPDAPDVFTSLLHGARSRLHLYGTHTITLPATHDTWRGGLDASFRRHVDRKYKRARPKGELRLRRVEDPAEVPALMQRMQAFRASRFGDTRTVDLVQDPTYFEFYCEVARAAVAGQLPGSLVVLELGADVAAVAFDVSADDGDMHLLVGYDRDRLRNCSPGLLIIHELIKDAIDRGLHYYDLTVGDEPYKADFGARPRPLFEVVHARTPLGFAADRTRQGYLRARRLAKRTVTEWEARKRRRADMKQQSSTSSRRTGSQHQ